MERTSSDSARSVLSTAFGLWDQRPYGRVRLGAAVIKDRGAWRNLLAYFLPQHETEVRDEVAAFADYGDVKILDCTLSTRRTKAILSRLTRKGVLAIPGLPEVSFVLGEGAPQPRRAYTWDLRFPVFYPFEMLELNGQQRAMLEDPHRMIFDRNLPFFPSIKDAVQGYLDTQLGDSTIGGSVFLLTPDYRARIWKLVISSKGLRAEIQCPQGSRTSDVIGKVFVSFLPLRLTDQGTAEIRDGFLEFATKDFPSRAIVALLDRKTGELIDFRDTQYGGYQGVSIETATQDVENLVRAGESETLEYKSQIPKGEHLARAVVAFANQKGGKILIGIGNHGEILGCEIRPDLRDQITRLVRSHCDPMPVFSVDAVTVEDKNVVIISVAEGGDKPYVAAGQGIYIRSFATSRIATRYEIDQMRKP